MNVNELIKVLLTQVQDNKVVLIANYSGDAMSISGFKEGDGGGYRAGKIKQEEY